VIQSSRSNLPIRVDHRSVLGPVRDQGDRGTCLAFAVTAAHEHYRYVEAGSVPHLSEEFFYWACKQIDGDNFPGTTFTSAQDALKDRGQPIEDLWPYDGRRDDADSASYQPPAAALAAHHFKAELGKGQAAPDLVKELLALGTPVVVGLRLTPQFYQPVGGHIMDPPDPPTLLGGHAVVIVGYENEPGSGDPYFIVRNSWGPRWGVEGHGYISYAHFERLRMGIWTILGLL
jgi:C1A family cysteine protease